MSRVSRHSDPPMARFVHASRVRLERIHRVGESHALSFLSHAVAH